MKNTISLLGRQKILSRLNLYNKTVILYGYDIENINYDKHENIILSNERSHKYLSIYVGEHSRNIGQNETNWFIEVSQGIMKDNYYGLNIDDVFCICLSRLEEIYKSRLDYIHSYEQILKFFTLVKDYYINHEESIYLLSCALCRKQIELIDIDSKLL